MTPVQALLYNHKYIISIIIIRYESEQIKGVLIEEWHGFQLGQGALLQYSKK